MRFFIRMRVHHVVIIARVIIIRARSREDKILRGEGVVCQAMHAQYSRSEQNGGVVLTPVSAHWWRLGTECPALQISRRVNKRSVAEEIFSRIN